MTSTPARAGSAGPVLDRAAQAALGNPHPALAATSAGRGLLALIGETIPMRARDDDLVLTICLAAPRQARK